MSDVQLPAVQLAGEHVDPLNFTVIARDPAAMAQAQQSLIGWATHKIAEQEALLVESEEQFAVAKKNKWRPGPWQRRSLLARGKAEFYRKIKQALEAGYYIVPPFPLDIFAIRTKRHSPIRHDSSYRHDSRLQRPSALPMGSGEYVSDVPKTFQTEWEEKDKEGKPVKKVNYYAGEFQDIDFPFALAKPEIMNATAEAMALKVFDAMGALPASKRTPDPIICGQVIDPTPGNGPKKAVTFIVAWWLDTSTL